MGGGGKLFVFRVLKDKFEFQIGGRGARARALVFARPNHFITLNVHENLALVWHTGRFTDVLSHDYL